MQSSKTEESTIFNQVTTSIENSGLTVVLSALDCPNCCDWHGEASVKIIHNNSLFLATWHIEAIEDTNGLILAAAGESNGFAEIVSQSGSVTGDTLDLLSSQLMLDDVRAKSNFDELVENALKLIKSQYSDQLKMNLKRFNDSFKLNPYTGYGYDNYQDLTTQTLDNITHQFMTNNFGDDYSESDFYTNIACDLRLDATQEIHEWISENDVIEV